MGSTGGGGGSRKTAPGTRMNVTYRGSNTTSVYEQRRNGVYNVTNGGRGTRTGVRDLEEIRRNARSSGNRARRQRGK